MNDLIERLEIIERYLLDVSNGKDAEYEYAECIHYTITALREQEAKIERLTSRGIEDMQTRIAELEAAEERSAEYLAESVENEVEALEKIERLDAALAEIEKMEHDSYDNERHYAACYLQDIARKARAGDD